MLDSPYVRRVAVSLQLLGLPFEHQSISVFRGWDRFRAINPVVKAPTLVCDDGTVLMDSTLILEYAAALARPRSLMPAAVADLPAALRTIGLALAACEKSVQIVYEQRLRPEDKQHEPWLSRVSGQMLAARAAGRHRRRHHPGGCDDGRRLALRPPDAAAAAAPGAVSAARGVLHGRRGAAAIPGGAPWRGDLSGGGVASGSRLAAPRCAPQGSRPAQCRGGCRDVHPVAASRSAARRSST